MLSITWNAFAIFLFIVALWGAFSGELTLEDNFKLNVYGMLALILGAVYKDKR